jgi:hypothetical protein
MNKENEKNEYRFSGGKFLRKGILEQASCRMLI